MKVRRIFKHDSTIEGLNCIVYINHDTLTIQCFSGKRVKHDFYIRYKTIDRMNTCIDEYIKLKNNIYTDKMNKKAEIKNRNRNLIVSDFYKIGDIICNSWGCEQTNIDFFQVVEVKNRVIKIKEVYKEYKETGFLCGNSIPLPNRFKENGREYQLRVSFKYISDEPTLSNPKSYYYMHKWSGKPEYESHYA